MRLNVEGLESRENPTALAAQVPAELWRQLAADVRVLAEGTVPPSPESVRTFVVVARAAFADGKVTQREFARLVTAANAVLESANVPPAEVQAVIADIRAILAARRS